MNTIHQDAPSVNQQTLTICANNAQTYGDPLANATASEWFSYLDTIANRKVVQGVGYSNGVVCSARTRAGKLHELNGFNIRDNLLESIIGRYHTFLIRITWKRSGRKIHYSIPIDTIKQVGTPESRYDGLQWHVPMHYWSIDGAEPTGPKPEPEPVAEQVALFDFAELRRGVAY